LNKLDKTIKHGQHFIDTQEKPIPTVLNFNCIFTKKSILYDYALMQLLVGKTRGHSFLIFMYGSKGIFLSYSF